MAEQPGMSQLLTSLLPLGALFLVNKVDLEEQGLIPHLRVGFGTVALSIAVIYAVIFTKIRKNDEEGRVKVPAKKMMGQEVKPSETISINDYDTAQLREMVTQLVIMTGMMGLMHFKWGHNTPLTLQLVMLPTQLFQNALFKLHILGKDIARPFPEKSLLPGMPAAPAAEPEEEKKMPGKRKVKPH